MRLSSLVWIFDVRVEPPAELGPFWALLIRWASVIGLLVGMNLLAALIAMLITDDHLKRVEIIYYTRAVLGIVFACWLAYATYSHVANKNRQKQKELTAMYREIAKFYHEQKLEKEFGQKPDGD